eukprot:TRINITY_DN8798_c0_g1_i1.p1 TRINITY_DN8798_c0_g1~~TRINITY_DN8798_c0_g1_i1.p1  ORF type:complete len:62 (-),score=6.66 TRINITY_DN8798_c0_g1_i1:78-263(-)
MLANVCFFAFIFLEKFLIFSVVVKTSLLSQKYEFNSHVYYIFFPQYQNTFGGSPKHFFSIN